MSKKSKVYFETDAFKFLTELSSYNNSEWFKENKSRFESGLKAPFISLLEDLSKELKGVGLPLEGGERTIFRINRDTRFSSDKSPYNTHISGVLTKDGAKQGPGGLFYLHIDQDGGFVACGLYQPETARLQPIREAIIHKTADFEKLLKKLESSGLPLDLRDSTKAMPKGFNQYSHHPFADHVRSKNFMVTKELDINILTNAGLLQFLVEIGSSVIPLFSFLDEHSSSY